MIDLIILGSGTSIPSSDRASPSLAMITGDEIVLFDMGPGSIRRMAKVGLNHEKIRHVFFTHFHPDHTADLIHFLFLTRNPPILARRSPFSLTGAKGFNDFISGLQRAFGKWLDMPSRIMTVEEFDNKGIDKKGYQHFDIFTAPMAHIPNSIAYRVEGSSGGCFVYAGDTDCCREIIQLSKDADLLILESSYPDQEAVKGHMTPSRAGRIATKARVKKLMLIHFYPEVLKTDIVSQCRKTYDGELVLGRDSLHIRID